MRASRGRNESTSRPERTSLDDTRDWSAVLADALEATGGPMTDEERAWADYALGHTDTHGDARPTGSDQRL